MKKIIASLLATVMAFSLVSADHHGEDMSYGTEDVIIGEIPEGTMNSPMMSDISVFYNGVYIYFEDAQPEIKNGSTFVPIRAFADALGAETGFDDATRAVTITVGEDVVSFVVGTNEVSVNSEVVTLSANTYISMERTMVPARLISEAFDLDVSWTESTRTVSILDTKTLKEGIDTDYTIINKLLASQSYDLESNMLVSGSFDFKVDAEGQVFDFNTEIDAIVNKEYDAINYDLDVNVNLEDVIAAYEESMAEMVEMYGEEMQTTVDAQVEMLKLLENFNVEYVLDMETLDIYIKTDILPLIGSLVLGSDMFEGNPWIKISYSDLLPADEYNELLTTIDEISSGEMVMDVEYMVDLMITSTNAFPYGNYETISSMLEFINDENFEKSGNTYTLDKEFNSPEDAVSPYSTDVLVKLYEETDGSIVSYDIDVDFTSEASTMGFTINQESLEKVKMDFEITNTFLTEFTISGAFDLTSTETDDVAVKVPDGEILDFMDLLSSQMPSDTIDVSMP